MQVGSYLVVVEVVIDVGQATLLLSAVFELPQNGPQTPEFWAAFHRGLDAAVLAHWRPGFRWQGSESSFQPYSVSPKNLEAAIYAVRFPADSAARWQVIVDLPAVLEVGNRYQSLNGEVRRGEGQ